MAYQMTRRDLLISGGAVLLLAACSGSSGESAETTTTAAPGGGEGPARPDVGRIVVLGQEDELANVLALGVTPVAAGANVPDAGFRGIAAATDGIEALDLFAVDAEDILLLRPDKVVTTRFFANEAGSAIDQLGEVVVLDDQLPAEDLIRSLAEALGREAEAEALLEELDAARDEARAALDGLEVSVAAVYPGPSVAAFVAGPSVFSATLLDAGCTLVPGEADAKPDQMGRSYLSRELLDVLSAPRMVLLQSELVEGETAAVAEIGEDAIWQDLPAVKAGAVTTLDRLGYAGIPGRIRLVADLIAALT